MTTLDNRDLGSVHHWAGVLVGAMALYNVLRWRQEKGWRNFVNAGVCVAFCLWEKNREDDHRGQS